MKIWHLTRLNSLDRDEVIEFVVIASNARDARRLAAQGNDGDEGPADEGAHVWLDPKLSRARAIGEAFPGLANRVVVRHFAPA